jgi:hypothetical protein
MSTSAITPDLNGNQLAELKHKLLMEGVFLPITAPLVRHVQRAAHLSLAAACEELAEQAQIMARDSATQSKPQRSREYLSATRRLDGVRRLLTVIGWDESTTPPAEPGRLDAKPGGYHDTVLWLSKYVDTLYDALSRVLASLDEEGASESGAYASLLELRQVIDGWAESIQPAEISADATMEIQTTTSAPAA